MISLRGRVSSLLGVLAIGIYGFAALASGLDRMAERSPSLERLVPLPFRAGADRAAARSALSRGQVEDALQDSRRAVAYDPVDPHSAALLGAAALEHGNQIVAESAYRVAATRGWRDASTQMYWYEAALQSSEFEIAVDRADALLRTHPEIPLANEVLAPLESDVRARRILLSHLDQNPPWLVNYLNVPRGSPDALVDRRFIVLNELGFSGHPVGCKQIQQLTRVLLLRYKRKEAQQVWNANCPTARVHGGIADLRFDDVDGEHASPFGWQILRTGDLEVQAVALSKGGQRLSLRSQVAEPRLFMRQVVSLSPGAYRLEAAVSENGVTSTHRVVASVGCSYIPFPSPEQFLSSAGQSLTVPLCEHPVLGLWLRPGEGEVSLDSLKLVRTD